jgi:transposase
MAWTAATRWDYARQSEAYASDVTEREWALIAPHLPPARSGGRPRTTCLRDVVNAIFYLLQTGCQWRMLPREFPPRSTVYGYSSAGAVTEPGRGCTMRSIETAATSKAEKKAPPPRSSTAKA